MRSTRCASTRGSRSRRSGTSSAGRSPTAPWIPPAGSGRGCRRISSPATMRMRSPSYVASVAGLPVMEQPGGDGGGEGSTDGETIFTQNCGSCHTLAAAGTTGTIGPNLDDSKPTKELAVDRVTNGMGAMPAFEGTLSPEQIERGRRLRLDVGRRRAGVPGAPSRPRAARSAPAGRTHDGVRARLRSALASVTEAPAAGAGSDAPLASRSTTTWAIGTAKRSRACSTTRPRATSSGPRDGSRSRPRLRRTCAARRRCTGRGRPRRRSPSAVHPELPQPCKAAVEPLGGCARAPSSSDVQVRRRELSAGQTTSSSVR